jgi:hypothetical protein
MRLLLVALALPLLAGCASTPVWAPDESVARARYVHDGPPEIAVITVLNNNTDEGAHSALMISGSERVMFDPAGSWYNPVSPERNDVHFGITPSVEARYLDYHSRVTFRTVVQRVPVTREVADRAIELAKAYGAVPQAMCAVSTSAILRQLPGFDGVRQTWFPKSVMADVSALPGATMQVVYDNDSDDNKGLLAQQVATAGTQ